MKQLLIVLLSLACLTGHGQSFNSVLLSPRTTTPTLYNGQIWYDATTNKFKVREGGVTKDAVGGGGGGLSGLTSGRVTFATSGTTIGDDANLTWNNTNKNLIISGGTAVNRGNIQFNSSASSSFDTNIILLGDPSQTGGFIFGSTAIASGSVGSYFIGRGNTYPFFTQRGNIVIGAGNPSTPATGEGEINFYTGADLTRLKIDKDGGVGIGSGAIGASVALDIQGTTKAFKMGTATRASIVTPVNGMVTTDTNVPYFHDGTAWDRILESTSPPITTSITTPSTSFDLLNTTATTVNAFGAATTLTIGAISGTLNLRNATITAANATSLNLNGASPSITSTSTGTASLFHTNILTGNIFGSVTTLNMGTLASASAQTMNIGASTAASTYNLGFGNTSSGNTKTLNLGTGSAAGSTTNVNIGSATASAVLGTLNLGFPTIAQPTNYTSLNLFNTQTTTVNQFGAVTTYTLGGTPTTALTATLFGNATATGTTKIVNLATAGAAGSTTNVNIGSATTSAILGTLTLGFPSIVQPANYNSLNLFNSQTVVANLLGAATTVNIGAPTGTITLAPTTTLIRHLDGGTNPPGIAAGAGAGTSPTVSMGTNSSDLSGIINITTGTTPTGTNAIVATITFSVDYLTAPFVTLTPANRNAQALTGATVVLVPAAGQTNGVTTTTFVIESGATALAASTAYIWYYQVIQ